MVSNAAPSPVSPLASNFPEGLTLSFGLGESPIWAPLPLALPFPLPPPFPLPLPLIFPLPLPALLTMVGMTCTSESSSLRMGSTPCEASSANMAVPDTRDELSVVARIKGSTELFIVSRRKNEGGAVATESDSCEVRRCCCGCCCCCCCCSLSKGRN